MLLALIEAKLLRAHLRLRNSNNFSQKLTSRIEGEGLVKLKPSSWGVKLLCLFLATDACFILIHVIHPLSTPIPVDPYSSLYSIEADKGYAEIFQYVKEFWIALLLSFVAVKKRSLLYISWSLLFFYLLLDDSIQVHERLGLFIADKLRFSAMLNIRPNDFGELLVSAVVGSLLLASIAVAYRFGDQFFRRTSKYLIAMLLALAGFGVIVDILHVITKHPKIHIFLGILEDGGEMMVMSAITCLVLVLSEHSQTAASEAEPLKEALSSKF